MWSDGLDTAREQQIRIEIDPGMRKQFRRELTSRGTG
jgi:hypothetical protein